MNGDILITAALIARLEEIFPNRLPPPGTDIREIDRRIGQNDVVAYLKAELESQSPDPFEKVA